MNRLTTPTLLVDQATLQANISAMQAHCTANHVQLWPHIKTHKCIEIAKMQLEAGAKGLVCAKLGEAEAMLPSGVRHFFIAYPLVDPETQARRVKNLAESLETLIVAATSLPQAEALGRVLDAAEVTLPVLMAVDTGLGREGARGASEACALADFVRKHPRMTLVGLFTHEGQAYRATGGSSDEYARDLVSRLSEIRDQIDPALTLWPGCSVTAKAVASQRGVHAVRPGAYVFGDLSLATITHSMDWDDIALTVLTTVVDRPSADLALIDGGSKSFSSDSIPTSLFASLADGRDIHVTRVSEEHGFATGSQVDELRIGDQVAWVPAHVCPAVNLADELTIIRSGEVIDRWKVAARGRVG